MSPTRTPPMQGERAKTTPRRGRRLPTSLPFVFQHRGVTFNARNRIFAVDLSGARPQHWKSEVLSIKNKVFRYAATSLSLFAAGAIATASFARWSGHGGVIQLLPPVKCFHSSHYIFQPLGIDIHCVCWIVGGLRYQPGQDCRDDTNDDENGG